MLVVWPSAAAGPAASGRPARGRASCRRTAATAPATGNRRDSIATSPSAFFGPRPRRPVKCRLAMSGIASRLAHLAAHAARPAPPPCARPVRPRRGRSSAPAGRRSRRGRAGSSSGGSACRRRRRRWRRGRSRLRSRAYSVRCGGSGPCGPNRPKKRFVSTPGRLPAGGRERRDRRRRKGQRRLLPQTHPVLARPPRGAQRRRVGELRLDDAQRMEDVVGLGRTAEPLEMRQIIRPARLRPPSGNLSSLLGGQNTSR